ncbi:MAG: type II toxin-antitoxin system HicA family toxin [Deltaproteobacteria bacterium]|nr:type II toxin-antitoxin system HicA family toxin [Deltaproteobacteria bacterium]
MPSRRTSRFCARTASRFRRSVSTRWSSRYEPSTPRCVGARRVRTLQKNGFRFRRQTGSHIILRRDEPPTMVTVPHHKVLDRGTLRAIIRQSGLTVDEFLAAL